MNRQKTGVAYISKIKFFGYSFYVNKGIGRLRVHPKSIAKMKEQIKTLTSRSNGWGYASRKGKFKAYIRGWVNYFKLADMQKLLSRIDEWYRRRLRMVIWKQWKRVRTRLRNLIKLGIPKYKAWQFANTRKGYWNTAKSPILSRTLTTPVLIMQAISFLRIITGSLECKLKNRPVRNRTQGGVRGQIGN